MAQDHLRHCRGAAMMGNRRHRRRGPGYGRRSKPAETMSAAAALEMAETMSGGEAAQLAIAAEILGVEYDEFIERLARESEA